MKKLLILAVTASMLVGCGQDKYGEINTDTNAVTSPDPSYLALAAQQKFSSGYYSIMFYAGNRYILPWSQMTVGDRGSLNPATMFSMEGRLDNSWRGAYYDVGKDVTKMQFVIDNYDEAKKASYQSLYQMGNVMKIFKAIQASDLDGNICYTEAFQALDYNPALITPKFDSQESVLMLMDSQLAEAVEKMSNPEVAQVTIKPTQDLFYTGKYENWVKTANSLRLRIAYRLIYANLEKAKSIVEEVIRSGKLYESIDDELRYYGGKYQGVDNDFGEGIWPGSAPKNLVEFLKKNRDPRVRFFYAKNPYNATIMNGLLAANVVLPPYILEQAVLSADGKTFIRWKDSREGEQYLGEPWVRYHGLPEQQDAYVPQSVKDMYIVSDKFKIRIEDTDRVYLPYSDYNNYANRGSETFTYPSLKVAQDQYKPEGKFPYTSVMFSTAEVKLILSLFTLKGVQTGKDANTWFQEGVKASVQSFDKTAKLHNQPYYSAPYDLTKFVNADGVEEVIEKPTGLQAGELDILLTNDAYKLTGDHSVDMEKVFIQLMLNSFLQPTDTYTHIKFGGVPKTNSTVLKRALFTESEASEAGASIPRRMKLDEPGEDGVNYANQLSSITSQGFTPAADANPVMTQRYWVDKNAPAWGAGPGL